MSAENPLWSRRRIASELAKLGHDVSKDTVAKYMPESTDRPGRPPSTTWAAFLRTHLVGTLAIDFLSVPTVTFKVVLANNSARTFTEHFVETMRAAVVTTVKLRQRCVDR